jgi:hypothetical protein
MMIGWTVRPSLAAVPRRPPRRENPGSDLLPLANKSDLQPLAVMELTKREPPGVGGPSPYREGAHQDWPARNIPWRRDGASPRAMTR